MWLVLAASLLAVPFSQESSRTLDELFSELTPSTQASIKVTATGFDPIRSPRIQFVLLKEHLVWQNRGYTDRQMSLIAVLTIRFAIPDAEARIESLGKKAEEDIENAAKYEKQIYNIEDFIERAKEIIEREKVEFKLEEMPDYMLKFYF